MSKVKLILKKKSERYWFNIGQTFRLRKDELVLLDQISKGLDITRNEIIRIAVSRYIYGFAKKISENNTNKTFWFTSSKKILNNVRKTLRSQTNITTSKDQSQSDEKSDVVVEIYEELNRMQLITFRLYEHQLQLIKKISESTNLSKSDIYRASILNYVNELEIKSTTTRQVVKMTITFPSKEDLINKLKSDYENINSTPNDS
jgi:hypothetical protein